MTPRFYSARLVRNGPPVGVKLFFGPPIVGGETLDRSPRLQCLVDLEPDGAYVWQLADDGAPVDVEGYVLRNVRLIDEAEYRFLTARREYARDHAPHHIAASPREAVDVTKIAPIF